MEECSLDTNIVGIFSMIYACQKRGSIMDKAYSELAANGFSYGVDVFRKLCKLLDKIEKGIVIPHVSPIVLAELSTPSIPKQRLEDIEQFLTDHHMQVINTSKFDYAPLVAYYQKPMGEDSERAFKEKSKNDAYIMAHSTYAGLPVVTCNFSDFTKGHRAERIRKRNEEFYKANSLKDDENVSKNFPNVMPYIPYNFVEVYLVTKEKQNKMQERQM